TVDDMYKWQKAITNHELINKKTTEKVFTNYTTSNGNPIDNGYGWHVKNSDDYRFIEHGGSIFGFKSMGVYIPKVDLYVIGFSNCDCNSPTQLVRDIARLILSR
ncbi:serine hydrolase, partial [Imtechella halotolerans]